MYKTGKFNFGLKAVQDSLGEKIKYYKESAKRIEEYLKQNPLEWEKYQGEFDSMVDNIFRDIMDFESIHLAKGEEDKIYKLRNLFNKKFREIFLKGQYINWSFEKPFGYAGDFQIIEYIYDNKPKTTGFERLFDNYFQQTAASVATRERKEDFKQILCDVIDSYNNKEFRVMNLASGPAREIKELLNIDASKMSNVVFDCYDNDVNSIEFASSSMSQYPNVNFFKKNAIRLALKGDIQKEIPGQYNLIYSTGLFDYLDEKIATKLVQNLRKLLADDGLMIISNYREQNKNPSLFFMELAGDWSLVYRSESDFLKVFLNAGFDKDDVNLVIQKSGVMQYCFAKK